MNRLINYLRLFIYLFSTLLIINTRDAMQRIAFLLAFCLISVNAVDWSTLTAQQLSQLPESEFNNINSNELSSIPAAAIPGFRTSLVAAINPSAINGFSVGQLYQLPPTSCDGFTGPQLTNLAADKWSALDPLCINILTTTPGGGCSGFTPSVLPDMQPAQIGNITAQCISAMPSINFAGFDYQFYAYLSPSACNGFTYDQVKMIPALAGYQWTQGCVANLPINSPTCGGFSAEFIYNMPYVTFSGFTAGCISQMNSTALSQVTPDQINSLAPVACSGLTKGLVYYMPSSLAASLNVNCFAQFTDNACSGLTEPFLNQLSMNAYAVLRASCLSQINAGNLNPDMIQYINPEAFSGINTLGNLPRGAAFHITNDQWRNIGPSLGHIRAFDVFAVFDGDSTIIKQWSVNQTNDYIDLDKFMYLLGDDDPSVEPFPMDLKWNDIKSNLNQLTWIKVALLKLGQEQEWVGSVAQFPPGAISGLRQDQVKALPPKIFQEFTPAQAKYFEPHAISVFSARQIGQLQAATFAAMSFYIQISPDAIPGITEAQMATLNNGGMTSFTCSQLREFSSYQLDQLSSETMNYVNGRLATCDELFPRKPSNTPIVLAICGTVIIVVGIIAVTILILKRRKDPNENIPLLSVNVDNFQASSEQ